MLLTDLNYEMAEKKGRDKTLSTYVNQLTKRFYLTLETASALTSFKTLDFENALAKCVKYLDRMNCAMCVCHVSEKLFLSEILHHLLAG